MIKTFRPTLVKMPAMIACLFLASVARQLSAQPYYHDEPLFPLQDKHAHGSSIVECPNGDLLACWFFGSGERTADDVIIQGARLKKGAKNWSTVFLMADTPNFPDCNPVLFIDQKERLWLFWITVTAHRWERSILKYRISSDYQKAGAPNWDWQDIILLNPGEKFAATIQSEFEKNVTAEPMWSEYALPYVNMIIEAAKDPVKREIGWMTRIHPLVLGSGRILLPLYSDGFNICLAAISDDVGEHWRASSPMVGLGPIQPTFIQKNDGTLVAYFRDSGDPPMRVLKSVSQDNGETWSFAVDTEIPNPGSSLEVIKLKDNRWLMAYNDVEEERHSMALSLSDDEGNSWHWKKNINVPDEKIKSYAYPSLIQAKDGLIHLTFSYHEPMGKTIKHAVFNVEWLGEKK